ncbi:hypothetical protein Taro_043551 [Colocasia esculenta]|uniref:Pentatricopeptide repeat-containing protein n=1 Tax=Colocasia esculenta TaxID=4460 RepID=A0A843WSE0_COLES|nr:hypothetical protein [Colocasia esculenta]
MLGELDVDDTGTVAAAAAVRAAAMEALARRLLRMPSPRFPLRPPHHILSLRRHGLHYEHVKQRPQEHPHHDQPSHPDTSDNWLLQRVVDIVVSGVGGLDEMESALDQLPSSVSSELVAHVFGSSTDGGIGDTRRLLRFFSWSWRKAGGENTHGDSQGKIFSRAIRTFADRSDATALGILVADLQRERCEMDLDTFICAAESLIKSGRVDDAVRLFRMLENDTQQQEQRDGASGSGSGRVVAIVHALCARGHARKAEGVVWHHRDKLGPAEKPSVYLSILHGWCVRRNARDARRVLGEMKSAGILPGLASYNTFLGCLCERNLKFNPSALIPEGFSVIAEMKTAGVLPTSVSFNILLSFLVRARRVKEAFKVLHSMRVREAGRPAPDWVSYYLVARVLYLTGRFIRGNRVIRQMLEDGVVPEARFFRSLIGLLCGVENVDIALEVFDYMKKSCGHDCGPAYDLLITKLCKNGKFDVGRRLWDEAVERGILLGCSGDLLDPSKTQVFQPTKNVESLYADGANSLLKKKKKKKGVIRVNTKKRRKKRSCST